MKKLYNDEFSRTRVVKAITYYLLSNCIDLKKMKNKKESINEFGEILQNFSDDIGDRILAKKIINFVLCENIKIMEEINLCDFVIEDIYLSEEDDYWLREDTNDLIPSFAMIIFNYISFSRKLDKIFFYCLDAFLNYNDCEKKLERLVDYIEIHKELKEKTNISFEKNTIIDISSRIKRLYSMIEEKDNIISELKKENESNIDRIKKLISNKSSLKSNIKENKEEFKNLEKENKKLISDISVANLRNDNLEIEISELKKINYILLQNKDKDITELKLDYIKQENLVDNLRKRNKKLNEENEKLKIEIEKLQSMQDDIITDLKKEEDDKRPEIYAGERVVILGGKWNDVNKKDILEYYDADFIVAEDIKRNRDKIKNYDYVLFDASRNSHGNLYLIQKIKPSYRIIDSSNLISVQKWLK